MRKKKCPIYLADFETTPYEQYKKEGETKVYLWCLKSLDEKQTYMGVNIDTFFSRLYELNIGKIVVYFHNLSFDGEFIMWYLLKNNYSYGEKENQTFTPIIDETGNIYMINVWNNDIEIEIRCSYKLFPKSIEDIGEMVGVKKLNETHNYEEIKNYNSLEELPQEEIDYINNDVTIMCRLIKYLEEVGINGVTMSSSAYKNWRKDKYFLCKNQFIKDENDEINEIVRKSYRGGITKVNKKYEGVELEDVISFDVNSLYPSVMYDNPMPIGMGKIYNSIKECIEDNRFLYIVVVVITKCKVKKGFHSFIGDTSGFTYSRKYNYSDELTNKILYLWDKEYELFKKIYEGNYLVSKVVGYKKANYVFKDYIDRWYAVKENATNPTERQLAKLMLNSLYGKFGMNDNRVSKIPVGYNEDGIIYRMEDKTTVYYDKKVASFITSRARVKYATMMNLCGDLFIYGDTDSLYILGKEIPSIFKDLVDDKKMGYWKYEGHYTRFKSLKAKCYIKQLENGEIERKIAGCPKEVVKLINFENFETGLKLENCKKVKRKVEGGVVIGVTNFTINV